MVIDALAHLTTPDERDLSIIATLLLALVGSVISDTTADLLGTGDVFEPPRGALTTPGRPGPCPGPAALLFGRGLRERR